MRVIKIIFKVVMVVLLVPVFVALKMLEWAFTLTRLLSGWLFRILGFLFLLTSVGCLAFQLYAFSEIKSMLIAGVICLVLPTLANVIIAGLMLVEGVIKIKIKYAFA